MLTREQKANMLEHYQNKEDKILVSNILDKAYRFEREDKLIHTNFLNLHELSLATKTLDYLKIPYFVYATNNQMNKKVLFFIPSYIPINDTLFSQYMTCIKITPNVVGKVQHKDYMGSIYSLGLKNEMIGDIFATETSGYVFLMQSVADYVFSNLYQVAKQEVVVTPMDLQEKEVQNLSLTLEKKEYIVPSCRVDAVLAVVYRLSRNDMRDKIQKGDLCMNDEVIYYPTVSLKEGDIVSLKRCGKLRVGEQVRRTKSDRLVIEIEQYC